MTSRKLEFTGYDGSRLAGRLDLPDGAPRAYALFAHCFTGSKDVLASAHISAALARTGIAVLRFDFTGLGSSEGEFANTNFSSNVEDLVRAADMLRREHRAPALLVGHSLGGAAVLAAAGRIPEVKAVATLAAPSEPANVEKLFGSALVSLRDGRPAVEVDLFGRRFTITRQFVEDIEKTKLRDCVAHLDRALLVMHSPLDELVDIDQARRIYQAARHPKSFVSLVDADHLLTRRPDAEYAAQVMAAWVSRYLPASTPVSGTAVRGIASDEDPKADTVVVSESGGVPWACDVRSGRHHLVADEPVSYGGADAGPAPHDFVLAGLGACTAITLRMVAGRKGMPLEAVEVKLRLRKEQADGGQFTVIERRIELSGPLDEAQRATLLEIADKCPVHRTLTGRIEVRTSAEPAGSGSS